MSALTDALAHPDIKRVFLAEVLAGQQLTFWTLNSGSTWYASSALNVIGLLENGTGLTVQASIAAVDANAGSYFYDAAADRVYVHCTADASPYGKTLQAAVQFYFANHAKIFNDHYYEPRVKSAPNLSLRVEAKFTGISQIGGGSLTLENSDGFFDALTDLQWDAGSVTLSFGVDRPGVSVMAYADYNVVGYWRITGWKKDDASFTLTLAEYKTSLMNKLPADFYDRATYPNLRQNDVGKAIPIAYGVIKDATPICIDLNARTFQMAGHAITGFDGVRVKNESTGAWEEKSFASTDTATAQFTLSSADWADGKDIAVDFRGKPTAAGIVMDNAADIIEDLLAVELGEPAGNLNSASFSSAQARLDQGGIFNSSNRATLAKIGLYIDDAKEARSFIEAINTAVGSYLFSDSSGKFYYRVFDPVPGEGLLQLTEKDIASFAETTDAGEIYSKVALSYNRRLTQDWAESYVYDIAEIQYLRGQLAPSLLEAEAKLSDAGDAARLGQSLLQYEGRPQRTYQLTTLARLLLTRLPGDCLEITYPRHGLDGIFEILSLSHDLMNDKTTFVVGDLHGLGDRAGYWRADADALPTRFAGLAGYGSGDLAWNKNWDPEIKRWARQNVGYWTDDNGFADPTDPDSYIPSSWT